MTSVRRVTPGDINFSFVIPGLLAGSALPEKPEHTQFLLDKGIHIVVSLTEWKPEVYLTAGKAKK